MISFKIINILVLTLVAGVSLNASAAGLPEEQKKCLGVATEVIPGNGTVGQMSASSARLEYARHSESHSADVETINASEIWKDVTEHADDSIREKLQDMIRQRYQNCGDIEDETWVKDIQSRLHPTPPRAPPPPPSEKPEATFGNKDCELCNKLNDVMGRQEKEIRDLRDELAHRGDAVPVPPIKAHHGLGDFFDQMDPAQQFQLMKMMMAMQLMQQLGLNPNMFGNNGGLNPNPFGMQNQFFNPNTMGNGLPYWAQQPAYLRAGYPYGGSGSGLNFNGSINGIPSFSGPPIYNGGLTQASFSPQFPTTTYGTGSGAPPLLPLHP